MLFFFFKHYKIDKTQHLWYNVYTNGGLGYEKECY